MSESALRDLLTSGRINESSLLWKAGQQEWLPASKLGLTINARPHSAAQPKGEGFSPHGNSPSNQGLTASGAEGFKNWHWVLSGLVAASYAGFFLPWIEAGKSSTSGWTIATTLDKADLGGAPYITLIAGIAVAVAVQLHGLPWLKRNWSLLPLALIPFVGYNFLDFGFKILDSVKNTRALGIGFYIFYLGNLAAIVLSAKLGWKRLGPIFKRLTGNKASSSPPQF